MTARPMERTLERLRQAAQAATPASGANGANGAGPPKDAELLERFIDRRDEMAFASLVRRHAAMVLGVCRRVSGDVHDAEDSFQAVFCLLLLKARTIRRREALGSWLYGVAYRTALAAKTRRARARRREHSVDAMPHPSAPPPEPAVDWQPLLDAALERLPDKYRAAIVLCDLEGKSRREAAGLLHLAEGTLSSRLARGRRLLAKRLERQGLTLSSGALAALLASEAGAVTAPAFLIRTVIQAGTQFITKQAAAGAFGASVLSLAHGVNKAMLIGKLKLLASVLVVAALALGGRWFAGSEATAQAPPKRKPGSSASDAKAILPPLPSVPGAKQYRVELTLDLPDSAGPNNPLQLPNITAPRSQRLEARVDALVKSAKDGEARPAQINWEAEIIRERGSDVLVSFRLERKDRGPDAIVRGKSLEFEDFLPLNTWKEINDPALGGMAAKMRVIVANAQAQPLPPRAVVPPMSRADAAVWELDVRAAAAKAVAGKLPGGQSRSFRIFPLKHLNAEQLSLDVRKLLGPNDRAMTLAQTNSILVEAEQETMNRIAQLLSEIDAPPAQPKRGDEGAASAASADGQRLAVGSGQDVLLFDVRTGKLLSRNQQATGGVQTLAFSPDGKLLAAGTRGGAALLLDIPTGRILRQAKLPGPIVTLVFAPGGGALIISTENAQHVLDLATGVIRKQPQ
jgi:RNA polymerase sigma factor (sigma-70 family)